jgi:hypothetical protein
MLNVVMLSVANKPFMLRVFMLNVIVLSVVMLNVVAPRQTPVFINFDQKIKLVGKENNNGQCVLIEM